MNIYILNSGYEYDLKGNITKQKERRSDCGISGTGLGADALDRVFAYDPLERLISDTGRESDTQTQNDYTWSPPKLDNYPKSGDPNADNVRAYKRTYSYDKMSNIQSIITTLQVTAL